MGGLPAVLARGMCSENWAWKEGTGWSEATAESSCAGLSPAPGLSPARPSGNTYQHLGRASTEGGGSGSRLKWDVLNDLRYTRNSSEENIHLLCFKLLPTLFPSWKLAVLTRGMEVQGEA